MLRLTFLSLLLCVLLPFSGVTQVNYTAKDQITPYDGPFRPGTNLGYYPSVNQRLLGNLAAGNPDEGIMGVGAKVVRPVLSESVLEIFGYDVALNNFEHWTSLGMGNFTATLTGPVDWHRDQTEYCPGKQSALFANLYTPIWDGGANGTPYNDDNYFAAYVYQTVSTYTQYVDFWEIWNEPGFDYTGNTGWREAGDPQGNWWDNDPDPCDYILQAPIENYVRTLRIAYEVIKTVAPDDKVMAAGFGYQSFLDAVLRNTDNPDGGSVTAEYPDNGGAYFEIMGLHNYPHFDGTTKNSSIGYFERHSDRAAEGLLYRRDFFREIFDNYGYDGDTYPRKLTLATEMNAPGTFEDSDKYFASDLGQRNYIMKTFITAILNDVIQFHVFSISTKPTSPYGFHTMGLYKYLEDTGYEGAEIQDEGIAMKTTSDMLWGTTYDEARTAQMNLPDGVKGYAFQRPDGQYLYMMWAETTIDQSEFAEGTYDFPSSFGHNSLTKIEWDYAVTNDEDAIGTSGIALDATPIFLLGEAGTVACQVNASFDNVACDNQGTEDPSDDTFTFDLFVSVNQSNSPNYLGTINGQSFEGQYLQNKLMGPFLISEGDVELTVSAANYDNCEVFINVDPPAACSVTPPSADCENNLIENGDFTSGITDWEYSGEVNPSNDAVVGQAMALESSNSRIRQNIDVNPGSEVTFSGFAKVDNESGKAYVGVKFMTSSWVPIEKDYQRVEANNYEEFAFSYVAPSGTKFVQITAFTKNGDIKLSVDELCFSTSSNPGSDKPDLEALSISVSPASISAGDEFVVISEYKNAGADLSSVSKAGLYLSNDANLSSSDMLIESKTIAPINGNQIDGVTFEIDEYNIAPGDYYLIVNLDDENAIDEESESNNWLARAITVDDGVDPPGQVDCEAEGDFPWHDWISGVTFNGKSNFSGKKSYTDFTDVSFDLSTESSNTLVLNVGYSYFTFDEHFQIYIDFNQNGIYESDELYFQEILERPVDGTDEAVMSKTLPALPTPAFSGATSMRVVMSREGFNGPCGTFAFGEVEDYTVHANELATPPSPSFKVGAPTTSTLTAFPNPATHKINVRLSSEALMNDQLKLVNQFGQVVSNTALAEGQLRSDLNLERFGAGVYTLYVERAGERVEATRVVVLR